MSASATSAGKLGVFISYSRDDLGFADQLDAALRVTNFAPTLDRHGISGAENWQQRLSALIRDADTVVFALSPSSAASKVCAWEVEEAVRLGKRIIPVLPGPLGDAVPPQKLAELNYIHFYDEERAPGSGFGTGLAKLVEALDTDLEWLREHTRLLQRASEWEEGGRPSNRLLSGNDITDAKAWIARRPPNAPEPTALHLDFVRASESYESERHSEAQRQLAERERLVREAEAALAEKGLAQQREAEASKRAVEASSRAAEAAQTTARRTRMGLAAMSLLAVVAAGTGIYATLQSREADEQRRQAVGHQKVAEAQSRRTAQEVQIFRKMSSVRDSGRAERSREEQDRELFEQMRIAAATGNPVAMRVFGILYADGIGVAQDRVAAREWHEKAALAGDSTAMNRLGVMHERGRGGLTQDYVKAREWYEKAAAAGDTIALSNIGILYSNGRGVPRDFEKAREWYEKAAAVGEHTGMRNLAMLYTSGRGVPRDYAKAREWLEKAAELGDSASMTDIGVLYANGYGVSQDDAMARQWYEKAAAAGDTPALTNLGNIHAGGRGVPRDFAKAREYYEKAAAFRHPPAMRSMGLLYANGNGVPQDFAKARAWYEKAIAANDRLAMNAMDVLYATGRGVPQDYASARTWYEKAAAGGIIIAMRNLARLYENGHGVEKDPAKTKEWLDKAAAAEAARNN
jgi:TPR repeat protein